MNKRAHIAKLLKKIEQRDERVAELVAYNSDLQERIGYLEQSLAIKNRALLAADTRLSCHTATQRALDNTLDALLEIHRIAKDYVPDDNAPPF